MKMKNIIAAVLAVLLCLVLVSCGENTGDVPDGMKVLEQASGSYTVYVPESWITDVSTGFASAYVSNTDPSNVSFMAYTIPSDETTPDGTAVTDIDTFWQSYETDFAKTFSDMEYETYGTEKTEDGKEVPVNYVDVKLGGMDARKYTFYATVGGEEYEYMQVVAVEAQSAYLLTYTATRDAFEGHLDEVDKIIESFRFN